MTHDEKAAWDEVLQAVVEGQMHFDFRTPSWLERVLNHFNGEPARIAAAREDGIKTQRVATFAAIDRHQQADAALRAEQAKRESLEALLRECLFHLLALHLRGESQTAGPLAERVGDALKSAA